MMCERCARDRALGRANGSICRECQELNHPAVRQSIEDRQRTQPDRNERP